MRYLALLLATALAVSSADNLSYLASMIACEEKEELFVDGAFDAFLSLAAGRDVKEGELCFPVRLAKEAHDVVSFERAFYLTPNILRGFELRVPVECLRQKEGMWISIVPLTVAKQRGQQGITSLTLKKKEPNQALEPMPIAVTAAAFAPAAPSTGMAHL
jgi:hypothetical protein